MNVYHIEYVSYRQGPYRIRIDTAADRIVPALAKSNKGYTFLKYLTVYVQQSEAYTVTHCLHYRWPSTHDPVVYLSQWTVAAVWGTRSI